jgi:hypothetical protein
MTTRALFRASATLLAATLVLATAAPVARAVCNIYGFYEGTSYGVDNSPEYIYFDNTHPTWSAIGVRPITGEDWDVRLYSDTAPEPACLSGELASSTYGGSAVDFVIGDWAQAPLGRYYLGFNRYGSGSIHATAQWKAADAALDVNGLVQTRTIGTGELLALWTVDLVAGRTYNITYGITSGTADLKLMLFRNPGTTSYFAGRSSFVYFATANGTFTPTTSGTYAAVVVNDSYVASATIEIGVSTCSQVDPLVAGVVTPAPHLNSYWSFPQASYYWSAVSVRGGGDPDIAVYGNTAGASGYPACLGDPKAGSYAGSGVDFVMGDFNHAPLGTYYAWTMSGTNTSVEWDSGNDMLSAGASSQVYSTGADDILRVWDVALTAGSAYTFYFRPTKPGTRMLLFRNPGTAAYWAPRSAAVFEATGCQTYTAPTTDYYAVVVVNDTGDSASYALGVEALGCPCPTAIADNVPVSSPAPDGYFSFEPLKAPGNEYWGVIGTRGATTLQDWDLAVAGNATGGTSPACLGPTLASSGYGPGVVDVVAMDFNAGHTPQGTYYARAHALGGAGATGSVEFDSGRFWINENSPYIEGTITPADLVHSWDAYMVAGRAYTIDFYASMLGAKLLVFESPASGTYIAGRSAARLEVPPGGATYTPTVTGWHALVLVNDFGAVGSYAFRYGACVPSLALVNDLPGQVPYAVSNLTFTAPTGSTGWGAIGVLSLANDWDITVGSGLTGAFPNCVSGVVAGSTASVVGGYVDFVVGDWAHNAPGTYYAVANQRTNNPGPLAPVEWSLGAYPVLVNSDVATTATMGAANLLDCSTVVLTAGVDYTFQLNHSGAASLKMMLFRNPGSTYWMNRSGAVLTLEAGSSASYTAPATDSYGIVIVNDSGTDDTYSLTVKACPAPVALVAETPTSYWFESFNAITPSLPYWTGIGSSSAFAPFLVEVNTSGTGGIPGVCQSGLLARSSGSEKAQFVVGDFNRNAYGTYYVRTHYPGASAPLEWVDWDAGSDVVTVSGPAVRKSFTSRDVLDVYDAYLTGGQTYSMYFTHATALDAKAMVFRNTADGTYWAPRSAAMYSASGHGAFTAPSSGWYGLVVVNDNQGSGNYEVGLYPAGVGVQPQTVPSVTSLRSVSPNPARGSVSVELALHQNASVRVQLVDLAGRIVASVADGGHEGGVWTETWNGHFDDGTPAPPGIYMVRMEVDGKLIGQRKVALVR